MNKHKLNCIIEDPALPLALSIFSIMLKKYSSGLDYTSNMTLPLTTANEAERQTREQPSKKTFK